MLPSTSANRTPALSNRGIRYSRSSGSRMNRSHLKHSTTSTSRIASSYPGRYFPGLVGSFLVAPMSLSDSRYTTVQPRALAARSSLAIWLATPCS
jgi:hypothetical protein